MQDSILVENASFSYRDREVFSSLTFEVRKGEMTCLLGPNGCGKTTLFRCMSGALRLKQGTVSLFGHDISTLTVREIARRLAFLHQEGSVVFPYRVLQMVLMGRTPHLGWLSIPSKGDVARARSALENLGILHLGDRPYTEISGGERQLVLLARTLVQETQGILLDEPAAHLDFSNQVGLLETMHDLATKGGLAIAFTSHYPNHALLFSTTVALMREGKLVAQGSPDEVITEENLRRVYGIDVQVVSREGTRFVVPVVRGRRSEHWP